MSPASSGPRLPHLLFPTAATMMHAPPRLFAGRLTPSWQLPRGYVIGMIGILAMLSPLPGLLPGDHPTVNIRNTLQRGACARHDAAGNATCVGVTRHTIMNIEHGRTHPSLLLAYRLADILGVPVTDLFPL